MRTKKNGAELIRKLILDDDETPMGIFDAPPDTAVFQNCDLRDHKSPDYSPVRAANTSSSSSSDSSSDDSSSDDDSSDDDCDDNFIQLPTVDENAADDLIVSISDDSNDTAVTIAVPPPNMPSPIADNISSPVENVVAAPDPMDTDDIIILDDDADVLTLEPPPHENIYTPDDDNGPTISHAAVSTAVANNNDVDDAQTVNFSNHIVSGKTLVPMSEVIDNIVTDISANNLSLARGVNIIEYIQLGNIFEQTNNDDSDDSESSNLDDYLNLDAASVEERDKKHALQAKNANSSIPSTPNDNSQPSCSHWPSSVPSTKPPTASPIEEKNARPREKFPVDKPLKPKRSTFQQFRKALKEYKKCPNDTRARKKLNSIRRLAAELGMKDFIPPPRVAGRTFISPLTFRLPLILNLIFLSVSRRYQNPSDARLTKMLKEYSTPKTKSNSNLYLNYFNSSFLFWQFHFSFFYFNTFQPFNSKSQNRQNPRIMELPVDQHTAYQNWSLLLFVWVSLPPPNGQLIWPCPVVFFVPKIYVNTAMPPVSGPLCDDVISIVVYAFLPLPHCMDLNMTCYSTMLNPLLDLPNLFLAVISRPMLLIVLPYF